MYTELEKKQEEVEEEGRNLYGDAQGILLLGRVLEVCNMGRSSNVTSKWRWFLLPVGCASMITVCHQKGQFGAKNGKEGERENE